MGLLIILDKGSLSHVIIGFLQDTVYKKLHDGRTFTDLFQKVFRGVLREDAIPKIRILWRGDGLYVTHDNRRLQVFQWLALEFFLQSPGGGCQEPYPRLAAHDPG